MADEDRIKFCRYCDGVIEWGTKKCPHCGEALEITTFDDMEFIGQTEVPARFKKGKPPIAQPVDDAPPVVQPVADPNAPPVMKPIRPGKKGPPVVKPVAPGKKKGLPVAKPIAPGKAKGPPVVKPVAPGPAKGPPVVKPVAPGKPKSPPVVKPVAPGRAKGPPVVKPVAPGRQPPVAKPLPRRQPAAPAPAPVIQPIEEGPPMVQPIDEGVPGAVTPVDCPVCEAEMDPEHIGGTCAHCELEVCLVCTMRANGVKVATSSATNRKRWAAHLATAGKKVRCPACGQLEIPV